jgi:hypothetical protein
LAWLGVRCSKVTFPERSGRSVCFRGGGLYAVLDYHRRHGRLPLGETAVFARGSIGPPLLFVVALVILLFPDGG